MNILTMPRQKYRVTKNERACTPIGICCSVSAMLIFMGITIFIVVHSINNNIEPTLVPTTIAPTSAPTLEPTTLAPTTLAPTTLAPTTLAPTTSTPTTSTPTLAPTTPEPCIPGLACTTATSLLPGSSIYRWTGSSKMLFNTNTNIIYRWAGNPSSLGGILHTIDPDTNVYGPQLYTNEPVQNVIQDGGATYDYDNDIMYLISDEGVLYTFDPLPSPPTHTQVAIVPGFDFTSSTKQLMYKDGFLYAINRRIFLGLQSRLVKINVTTYTMVGSPITITSTDPTYNGLRSWQGLTLHRPSGTVYMAYRVTDEIDAQDRRIGTLDLDTAVLTPTCSRHMQAINAMCMGTDSRMWFNSVQGGGEGQGGNTAAAYVYKVSDGRPCNI